MSTFLITLGFFVLFMLALGVGLLLGGRGLKGACKGTGGCSPKPGPCAKCAPVYTVSPGAPTIHVPMK